MNPVDTKVRVNRQPKTDSWEILEYDAVGVVNAIGPEVEYFKVGDEVFTLESSTDLGPIANSIW